MPRPLREQVIVVTGASTGIGRETCLRAAARGAAVVLADHDEVSLRDAAEACQQNGGRALAVVTDVAEWGQVQRLAQQTVEHFGRIDTWVNNAAVTEYAFVTEMSIGDIERIIQVDLIGQIYGMKAALEQMLPRGAGTIINVASVLGVRAVPLQAPYCAAKHGIKGFTEALRMELKHAGTGINVTQVNPTSTNTPFFSHARSRVGSRPQPIPPVYEPSVVADAILFACEHPRRDIFAGGSGKLFEIVQRISPALLDWYMVNRGRMFEQQISHEPDNGRDNLFEPLHETGSTRGEWKGRVKKSSFYTRAFELHPNVKRAALGAVVLGGAALAARLASGTRNGT